MYELRLNDFCAKPVFLLRFEYVASVASTVPDELRICTFNVSYAVVVVVSAGCGEDRHNADCHGQAKASEHRDVV